MSKLVVIRLGKGCLNVGFSLVTAQYWETSNSRPIQFTGSLPPAPEIAEIYKRFQLIYESLHQRMIKRSMIEIDSVGLNNVSEVDFAEVQQQFYKALNDWLNSNSFRSIDQQLRTQLASNDELQVIFETNNHLLRQLPWHLWNFFEDYRHAEVGLSCPKYERVKPLVKKHFRNKVRILAILGNSAGIDVQKDRKVLEELPSSSTVFLVEPSRQELDKYLWDEKGWDILFFAGHTQSKDNQGKIHINQNSTLTIAELRNALKFAIQHGLKLAIFNSCDGLGLTQQLADLQIPQIIVMRLNIPDKVAQEFLKYFLTSFASGTPSYLAMRYARERLQGLEDDYPGVSWLPVACQNLAEEPATWEEMKNFRNLLPTRLWQLPPTVLLSALLTLSILPFLIEKLPLYPARSLPSSSFQNSCNTISITENNVSAKCRKLDGSYNPTNIILPGIRNHDGNLVFVGFNNRSNFYFANECKSIFIAGATISGDCRRNDGSYNPTRIILPGVHNHNGNLVINKEDKDKFLCATFKITKYHFYLCSFGISYNSSTASEQTKKVNLIFQKVLNRNATSYELDSYVNYLEKGATLNSITAEIIKTSSLLQDGNVISLDCQGNIITGLRWLDGRTENGIVSLVPNTVAQFTSVKWKVHAMGNGVVALENQNKIDGSRWLNGITDSIGTVNLVFDRDSHKSTEWKIHILSHGIIMLENQEKIGNLIWLNGLTVGGGVNLEPDTFATGTKWRIIKQ
jgi:CHAT domain/CVNH domain